MIIFFNKFNEDNMTTPLKWIGINWDNWYFEKQEDGKTWIEWYKNKVYATYTQISLEILLNQYPIVIIRKNNLLIKLSQYAYNTGYNLTEIKTYYASGFWLTTNSNKKNLFSMLIKLRI